MCVDKNTKAFGHPCVFFSPKNWLLDHAHLPNTANGTGTTPIKQTKNTSRVECLALTQASTCGPSAGSLFGDFGFHLGRETDSRRRVLRTRGLHASSTQAPLGEAYQPVGHVNVHVSLPSTKGLKTLIPTFVAYLLNRSQNHTSKLIQFVRGCQGMSICLSPSTTDLPD